MSETIMLIVITTMGFANVVMFKKLLMLQYVVEKMEDLTRNLSVRIVNLERRRNDSK